MADITMCPGHDCPKRNACYRFRAIPELDQYYFLELPLKDGNCEEFWGIEDKSRCQLRYLDEINNELNHGYSS